MPRAASTTLADLVVLSLLAERAMHGYELWAELERREVEHWASISRAQVYYSLRKLAASGLTQEAAGRDGSLGPDRQIYRPTRAGRRALANALARPEWATQHVPSPFLTWMVLSWQARPADFAKQLHRRRAFITEQLAFYRRALGEIIQETSPTSDAAMVVRLAIRQSEVELGWLDDVARRHRPG
ncbi:MAG TPA: helix-turn-helix transcriptional regulator [Gemmatimonadaceae bacterium]|nr:helix-turn-helix transcriptional regulator [Gemmatimonadaceae bacterium]